MKSHDVLLAEIDRVVRVGYVPVPSKNSIAISVIT